MKKDYIQSILAVLLMAVIAYFFFYPNTQNGEVLQQHDILQGLANGEEARQFQEATGETTRWTNSLFGGMPTFQISPSYPSTSLLSWIFTVYSLGLPSPCNILFIMMLGFFILGLCLKMRPGIAFLGAIAWGFSTYFIIIIGAGHIWKFVTLAYIPPTIAGIILCYRKHYIAGTALAALFGTLQLQANHPQMSYYFLFVIFFIVTAFLWNAVKEKDFKRWGIATACILGAGILATIANSPSLYNSYEYSKETIRKEKTALNISKKIVNRNNQKEIEKSIVGTNGESRVIGYDTYNGVIDPRQEQFDYITGWSYGKDESLSLLIPNIKGGASIKPVAGNNKPKFALGSQFVIETQFQQMVRPIIEQLYAMGQTDEYGNPLTQEAYDTLNFAMSVAQTIVSSSEYFGDQPGTNGPVYVGAFILLLAVLALFVVDEKPYSTIKWGLFAASILALLLAWGNNFAWFTQLFIDYFPGYSTFRTVSSFLVVVEFTIPLLAMLCLHKIITTPDFFTRYKKSTIGVFGIGVLICLIGTIYPSFFGEPFSASETEYLTAIGAFDNATFSGTLQEIADARLDLVASDSLRSLIFILIGSAIVITFAIFRFNQYILIGTLIVVTLIDLYPVNKRYVDAENFVVAQKDIDAFTPSDADKAILEDKSIYRVADFDDFGGARSSYFHKTIGGYHAAKLTRYNDIIDAQIASGTTDNALNMLNAKYIISDGKVQLNPNALGNAWFVDEIQYVGTANDEMLALDKIDPSTTAVADKKFESILGKASTTTDTDTIFLTKYAPNCLEYKSVSKNGGIAVFSEIYFPWGWEATIDEQNAEIGRANYVLRAINVPAGEHTISFRFDPQSIHTTDTLATIAIIMIYILCLSALGLLCFKIYKNSTSIEIDKINSKK